MSPSKILLFGEYTVLLGSQALAIPFEKYRGVFSYENADMHLDSNYQLRDLLKYIKINYHRFSFLDIHQFETDLHEGLYFKSNIPKQYGLGSSAALTAEIYRSYCKSPENNLFLLQQQLALIESFMHGKSSGFDPLVSYLNESIWLKNGTINVLSQNNKRKSHCYRFLVDSGKVAPTKAFVTHFINQIKKQRERLDTYKHLLHSIINAYIKEDDDLYFNYLFNFSLLHLNIFEELFLPEIMQIANEGIRQGLFALKLCGSGGGGYYLGFTNQKMDTIQFLNNKKVNVIFLDD